MRASAFCLLRALRACLKIKKQKTEEPKGFFNVRFNARIYAFLRTDRSYVLWEFRLLEGQRAPTNAAFHAGE
jgi:hypothetical protein